ncbi:MAG TPA: hypothetical protein VE987_15970 [Polyangiaceae bacterium]|nr:hypothetical protein [Polyangiaceae bacterium]
MSLVESIHAVYDRCSPCIHPFIGAAFRNPNANDVRVMAVGINAYSEEQHWGKQGPTLFAEWFAQQRYRFQRGVLRDVGALVAPLRERPYMLQGRSFAGKDSIYLTNAVKVYVREAEGKRADQLSESNFTAHIEQWRDELDAMGRRERSPARHRDRGRAILAPRVRVVPGEAGVHALRRVGVPLVQGRSAALRKPDRARRTWRRP